MLRLLRVLISYLLYAAYTTHRWKLRIFKRLAVVVGWALPTINAVTLRAPGETTIYPKLIGMVGSAHPTITITVPARAIENPIRYPLP